MSLEDEEMDTAKDQSSRVLDENLNWQAARGGLGSDKFLSRQRVDWQQGMAGSQGDKERREGENGKLDRVQVRRNEGSNLAVKMEKKGLILENCESRYLLEQTLDCLGFDTSVSG